MEAVCNQQAVRRVVRLVLTAGTAASQVGLSALPQAGLLDKVCHVPARPLRAAPTDTVLDCGYRLLCNALGRADRPHTADLQAKLDFFQWARTAITFVWGADDTCRVHVPEHDKRWASHLATLAIPHDEATWKPSWKHLPYSGAVRWLQYRWHLQAFPFQTAATAPTCPHCGEPDGSAHTFVQCSRAQATWQVVLGIWFGRDPQSITVADHVRSIVSHEQLAAPAWLVRASHWRSHGT
ncbi:hypothetical protein SDRG_16630, partial [Saprolegnia diclina VS20]